MKDTISTPRNRFDARTEERRNEPHRDGEKPVVSCPFHPDRLLHRAPPRAPASFRRDTQLLPRAPVSFPRARASPPPRGRLAASNIGARNPNSQILSSSPNPSPIHSQSATMNPLRPPSSSSRQGRAGYGRAWQGCSCRPRCLIWFGCCCRRGSY
jgi:hypothetical protein